MVVNNVHINHGNVTVNRVLLEINRLVKLHHDLYQNTNKKLTDPQNYSLRRATILQRVNVYQGLRMTRREESCCSFVPIATIAIFDYI
mmetsp:Transcript_42930/g.43528  ORF Transcript_42930/g.43528 Transcript_42930/m.43528 type:complete len:88 (-) Transcript_42930:115-378(-)